VRPSRTFSVIVVVLLASAAGAFSFAIARRLRTSPVQATAVRVSATSSAYGSAKTVAYRTAYAAAYRQGWSAGVAAARKAGRRAGGTAGLTAAARRAAEARRAAALQAADRVLAIADATVPRSATRRTQQCVQVGGGLCEVLGPAVTGRPCPPLSSPGTRGDVCVPQLLTQSRPPSGVVSVLR
jgi:hypothetical protein